MRAILFALLLGLAACATVAAPGIHPNVYVMRHLHTPAGTSDPDLTVEGQRYAQAVSDWFRQDPPDVIYVSDTKRTRQTVAPLALRLGLTPKVYDPRDTPALLAAVSKEKGTVLIVGHSNTVPDIVAGLGGERPGPLQHPDFGDIWRVAGPGHRTTHSRLSA